MLVRQHHAVSGRAACVITLADAAFRESSMTASRTTLHSPGAPLAVFAARSHCLFAIRIRYRGRYWQWRNEIIRLRTNPSPKPTMHGSRTPLHRSTAFSARAPWLAAACALLALTSSLAGCLAVSHGANSLRGTAPLHEFVVELPPVDLPATADHMNAPQPEPHWTVSPVGGWVHGFSVDVVDSRGDSVPSALMHHVKLMMPHRRELFMPIMLRVVGAGSETREARLPSSVGFPIQRGDSLLATAMLHNPTGRAHAGVRVRVRLHFSPEDAQPPAVIAYPFFLHVTPPEGHSGFDLPPGRSERSWEASPAVAGRILGLGGHIHRYGTELRLEDVSSGRVLWRARPRLDPDGYPVSIPRRSYIFSGGIEVRPDRQYRVTVVYDNPTGQFIPDGGMGTIGGIVATSQPWPEVDRTLPVYVLDRDRETNPEAGHHHHHGGPR
jgi:hypothetical protein